MQINYCVVDHTGQQIASFKHASLAEGMIITIKNEATKRGIPYENILRVVNEFVMTKGVDYARIN